MRPAYLHCIRCQADFPFELNFRPCKTCGDPLHVRYARPVTPDDFSDIWSLSASCGIGRFRKLLPIPEGQPIVSLGEGATSLIQLPHVNEALGLPQLFIKNEGGNPSWSFKDRLNSVNASLAKAHGFSGIIASSTGNHGASAAAYATAAGLPSVVLFPHGTPDIYPKQVAAYGGRAVAMNWTDRSALLARFVHELGWYPSKSSLPAPVANPFGLEGYKTTAFELFQDMQNEGLPDYIFIPVGSGDDYFGVYQGFQELLGAGLIDLMPTLVACEAVGSSPMADAFRSGAPIVTQVENPRTIAVSISEGIVSNLALHACRLGRGDVCTVDECEIDAAARALAKSGLVAETSSCVALAAVGRYAKEQRFDRMDRIVAVVTATGLRWPAQMVDATKQHVACGCTSAADALIADLGLNAAMENA